MTEKKALFLITINQIYVGNSAHCIQRKHGLKSQQNKMSGLERIY